MIFFSILHVVLCVFMIFVILLQPGKDAGMGAALGGGAATTAFGGRGAVTFLSKLTAASAVAFYLTSLGLSFVGVRRSVAETVSSEAPATAPAPAPEAAPAPAGPEAVQGSVNDAPGEPVPTPPAPGATDAVPAEKLPTP